MATPDSSSDTTAAEPAANSIRASKLKRQQAQPAPAQRTSTAPSSTAGGLNAVPEAIAKRFVQVGHRYYFPDGARAFTDRGNRLTTRSENTVVLRSLIGIAKAREWTELTVRGTERFRKDVWIAASLAGLHVRGYKPTDIEQSQLARTMGREKQRLTETPPSPGTDADSISRGAVGEEY